MHPLKSSSILILIAGIILFVTGIIMYWTINPVSASINGFVMAGILIMLGAIILLGISIEYDTA